MPDQNQEKPALLIIDMVRDNFNEVNNLPITPFARRIIEPINRLSAAFRKMGWPVIFSTDAFQPDDFIFTGRMKPHSLSGSKGAEIIDELDRAGKDLWLPKPRFSAFFNTDLAHLLHEMGVTLCAVAGIATNYCVLTTVMDALCHDFKGVFLEDCTAAASAERHTQTLSLYRRNPLYPLLRVTDSEGLLKSLECDSVPE